MKNLSFVLLQILTFITPLTLTLSSLAQTPELLNKDEATLSQGIHALYKNVECKESQYCLTPTNEKTMIKNAIEFKNQFLSLLQNKPNLEFKWLQTKSNAKEFEFNSPLQRLDNHPSNKVRGVVYFPKITSSNCELKFPANLILHKLGNDIDDEKLIASGSANSIVMIIYLPHFGPRSKGETFITNDATKFETNLLQALLDTHVAYSILRSFPETQKNNIGLMGLSLGAMISLISAGIDPIFDRYATNVGGGDLANIVTYKKSGDVDSKTAQALKDIDWSVDQARFHLSKMDAITWSGFARNKKFIMINAENDELINRHLSIDPLLEVYKKVDSRVQLIVHKGTHVFNAKEIGLLNTLTDVFWPSIRFLEFGAPNKQSCAN